MPQPGQLLTLKGVFRQPLARLSRRVTDRVSATKTRASQPRTFAQVWDWVTFCSDAIDRLEALDDQNKKLARRCTIKMPQIHRHCCGLRFEYIGAGSNRNFCFTDLLLRERCTTDIARLSAANWGTIEVKGPWQLGLPEDMSLAEAIAHPDYRTEVLPAVQQAYGDAVAAEAPVFAITNYEVTVFCHRNLTDVTDKRIWACPPISWNEAESRRPSWTQKGRHATAACTARKSSCSKISGDPCKQP
ncbi:hypothetical protein WJX79_004463 [Trebouxia sp. C0005]